MDFYKLTFSFFLFRDFIYLTPFELIFSLLPLQYCPNLRPISSAYILVFQWKNLILHNFSFNWKVAAATASFNHTRPRGASASIELLYEVTDALNLRCDFNGSHQPEYLLKMDSTTDISLYPKANYLSGKDSTTDVYILKPKANCFSIKGLDYRCLYSKARSLTLNGISKILWTGTITKTLFSVMQHTTLINSSSILAIHSNNTLCIRLSEQ